MKLFFKRNTVKENPPKTNSLREGKRLSLFRVFILLVIIGVGAFSLYNKWIEVQETAAQKEYSPWFAAYVDVVARPRYSFELLGSTPTPNAVLSFIVSSPNDPCVPSWGDAYTLEQAAIEIDLDRRIARLRQQGGNIVVSFGGLLNDELAVKCTDPDKLKHAYASVIDRYQLDTIDLDLESTGLTDQEAMTRRAQVIAELQQWKRSEGKSLAVWLTLPVAPFGMSQDGTNAVAQFLRGGVDLAGINLMTMDYGQSKSESDTMGEASRKALLESHRQLNILYRNENIFLSSQSIWAKIGTTPMIGQNDIAGEIFTLDDAVMLNKFATESGVGRISMWSANRDIQCGDNYVDVQFVSDSCSGIKQGYGEFAASLSKNFNGDLTSNSTLVTKSDNSRGVQPVDDPAESPYQIWSEDATYLEGAKVVWRRNVYQSKWWTQGDVPDNPVLQAWETPWQLIGPVLPGETPIPSLTLPAGTFAEWSGDTQYDSGDKVLFEGVPYQTKWWTIGDSPAVASSNPDNSAWVPLTQEQIEQIILRLEAEEKKVSPTPEPEESIEPS